MLTRLLVCVGWAVAGVAAQTPATSTPPAKASEVVDLPKEVVKMLNKRYPGWRLSALDGACQSQGGASPSLVAADLNGDNIKDYVLQLQATAPGVALVAILPTLDDYRIMPIATDVGGNAPRILSIVTGGTKYISPLTGIEEYFTQDTIVAATCTGERTAYVWVGASFTTMKMKNTGTTGATGATGARNALTRAHGHQ
jgi:hypothetical protein